MIKRSKDFYHQKYINRIIKISIKIALLKNQRIFDTNNKSNFKYKKRDKIIYLTKSINIIDILIFSYCKKDKFI